MKIIFIFLLLIILMTIAYFILKSGCKKIHEYIDDRDFDKLFGGILDIFVIIALMVSVFS